MLLWSTIHGLIRLIGQHLDLESIDLLNDLGLQIFKIASGEINNLSYLRHIGSLGKKVVLSTGMSNLKEVGDSLNILINAGTSVAVDTVLPDDKPAISDIEAGNEEQLRAFMFANLTETILYGIIGFLIFTNVVGPWAAQRRAKRKAEMLAEDKRRKDKYDAMKAELAARRNV